MKNILITNMDWYDQSIPVLAKKTGVSFQLIKKKEDVTFAKLKRINPRYVFIPHWSFMIPAAVYENFECVIFHMTDLPFGRGGSPLQNLLSRGLYKTKVTALRCTGDLDAGPVYLKRPLSLRGSAQEIYMRTARIVEDMMVAMVRTEPHPHPQKGKVVSFKRRKPEEGNISSLSNLITVYDFIRMLDADGYPRAFLETKGLRLEFERAILKKDHLVAQVTITKK